MSLNHLDLIIFVNRHRADFVLCPSATTAWRAERHELLEHMQERPKAMLVSFAAAPGHKELNFMMTWYRIGSKVHAFSRVSEIPSPT